MAISFVGSLAPVGANNGGNVTLTFSNLQDSSGGAATLQQNDLVIVGGANSIVSDFAMATSSTGWTISLGPARRPGKDWQTGGPAQ